MVLCAQESLYFWSRRCWRWRGWWLSSLRIPLNMANIHSAATGSFRANIISNCMFFLNLSFKIMQGKCQDRPPVFLIAQFRFCPIQGVTKTHFMWPVAAAGVPQRCVFRLFWLLDVNWIMSQSIMPGFLAHMPSRSLGPCPKKHPSVRTEDDLNWSISLTDG